MCVGSLLASLERCVGAWGQCALALASITRCELAGGSGRQTPWWAGACVIGGRRAHAAGAAAAGRRRGQLSPLCELPVIRRLGEESLGGVGRRWVMSAAPEHLHCCCTCVAALLCGAARVLLGCMSSSGLFVFLRLQLCALPTPSGVVAGTLRRCWL